MLQAIMCMDCSSTILKSSDEHCDNLVAVTTKIVGSNLCAKFWECKQRLSEKYMYSVYVTFVETDRQAK